MKTIGLIGGMSWESTAYYYKLINEDIRSRLGGLHSAKIIIYSVEFAEVEKYQSAGRWEKCGDILSRAAGSLEAAGADFILLGTNTLHRIAPQLESAVGIPFVHIADAAAREIENSLIGKVGLLGTKYTLTEDFFKQRLIDRGIEVLIPGDEDVEAVNDIIFRELCVGEIRAESRKRLRGVIDRLAGRGAGGVILGCTELGLIIQPEDSPIPIFDTTVIHARRAVELALES